jgi:hypothetical protein
MMQTSYDFGHELTEIVDHLIRRRGFHWPIFLAVIDQQGQMLLLAIKDDKEGIIMRDPLWRVPWDWGAGRLCLRHAAGVGTSRRVRGSHTGLAPGHGNSVAHEADGRLCQAP